jgi:hypothetical protein
VYDVTILKHAEVGADVGLARVARRRLFLGVDGVECKEGLALVGCDDAFAVLAVDDVPASLRVYIEGTDGVKDVPVVEDRDTSLCDMTVPDTQDEIVLCKEEGMDVGGSA